MKPGIEDLFVLAGLVLIGAAVYIRAGLIELLIYVGIVCLFAGFAMVFKRDERRQWDARRRSDSEP